MKNVASLFCSSITVFTFPQTAGMAEGFLCTPHFVTQLKHGQNVNQINGQNLQN
jgi:hypothetical protein